MLIFWNRNNAASMLNVFHKVRKWVDSRNPFLILNWRSTGIWEPAYKFMGNWPDFPSWGIYLVTRTKRFKTISIPLTSEILLVLLDHQILSPLSTTCPTCSQRRNQHKLYTKNFILHAGKNAEDEAETQIQIIAQKTLFNFYWFHIMLFFFFFAFEVIL